MAPTAAISGALLLLPALSLPLSRPSFQTAYKTTFDALIADIKPSLDKTSTFRLDIAVGLSQSYPSTASTSRTQLFKDLAELVQEVYSLACLAAVSSSVDLDLPGGLDIRVVLVEPDESSIAPGTAGRQHLSGPVVDLKTFVSSSRSSQIFSTESESGIALDKAFAAVYQSVHKSSPTIARLRSGPSLSTNIPTSPLLPLTSNFLTSLSPSTTNVSSDRSHFSVAVGGTFDHLHLGHKLLLTGTIFVAHPTIPASSTSSIPHRKITIGITGDALLTSKKHASVLESWSARQQRCQAFVESILVFHPNPSSLRSVTETDEERPNGKVVAVTYTPPPSDGPTAQTPITINYTQIQDPFGPTITEEDITALVLTAETRKGGQAVNEKRREKGWKELEVFEVGVLDASPGDGEEGEGKVKEGFESKISSTEIRRRMLELQNEK